MKYVIIGDYKKICKKEIFGEFDNLKECLEYLDWLNRSNISDDIRFKYKKIDNIVD